MIKLVKKKERNILEEKVSDLTEKMHRIEVGPENVCSKIQKSQKQWTLSQADEFKDGRIIKLEKKNVYIYLYI